LTREILTFALIHYKKKAI